MTPGGVTRVAPLGSCRCSAVLALAFFDDGLRDRIAFEVAGR
jgi:hypothetical protein